MVIVESECARFIHERTGWCRVSDFRRYLSDRDLETMEQTGEIFREVDEAADAFRALTGIRCPDGCGECCTGSRVEATLAEMLPLALDLWQKGEADFWLERISGALENPSCVFYRPDPENPLKGRCMVYEMRPLVCRLFGFFVTRNKHGRFVYSGCRAIKQQDPDRYRNAVDVVSRVERISVSTDFGIRTAGLDSGVSTAMVSINKAASAALLKIGYRLDLFRVAG